MFWNIARSAEAMFSRWAVRRAFKFMLKKKLGHLITGDIDLDQLDVQLGAGTVQLSDLAINVDYINKKLGTTSKVILKEGSIGSLLLKMPWSGSGCQIELNELEVVLTLRQGKHLRTGSESDSSPYVNGSISKDMGNIDYEMAADAATSVYMDLHEGVKTVAKMVKWLLTSFHVKIKRLIVVFDPCLKNEKIMSQMAIVLRITEIECGTLVSEDINLNGNEKIDSFLGMSRLTNFVKFQGAIMELLQMDEVDKCVSGSAFGERLSRSFSTATIPIMSGNLSGFSGTVKLSIPWKNGSLDIRKVDSEVCVEPVELKLQPRIIKWLLLTWESFQNLDIDDTCQMDKSADFVYYNPASHFHSSSLGSSVIATDKVFLNCGISCAHPCSFKAFETIPGTLLPVSNIITDWVPFSNEKIQNNADKVDFGASFDQFFECFDEMRSSQSALGGSGIWNWTGSVFSAITAASSLASGSLHIPSEQQHVQTNLKATITGFSVVFSFDDKNMEPMCTLIDSQKNCGLNAHFLCFECQNILLVQQVYPQEMKFEVSVKHIKVTDYVSDDLDIMDFGSGSCENGVSKTLFVQHLQAEVQDALPPFPSCSEDSVLSNEGATDCSSHLPLRDRSIWKSDCASITTGSLVKVTLLKSSGASFCHCTVRSNFSNGDLARLTTFSLELPPFVLWVNFTLLNLLLDFWKEVESSLETKKTRGNFKSEAINIKQGLCQENVKGGSCSFDATLYPKENLRGNIILPTARVILCFPFESDRDSRCYPVWDQFVALNFSSPLILEKKKIRDATTISNVSAQQRFSLTPSHLLCLNVGFLDLYLVTSHRKDSAGCTFCSMERKKCCAHNVICVVNEAGSDSLISMIWQNDAVTGPWLVKSAKELASPEILRDKSRGMRKDYEFATATTVNDVENSKFHSQKEMIQRSSFFLHVYLPTVRVNLDNLLYKDLYFLLNQVIDGFQCVSHDSATAAEDSNIAQTSLLMECNFVEISIYPDTERVVKGPMQDQLPGSWHCLQLKLQKFELLFISNIGGIWGACFLWIGHGEGKLWGSITGIPDREHVLISCSNSTMGRGDGGGSNALSYGLAGSDLIILSDPHNFYSSTSLTVRCCTLVAIGGRLDWLDLISSFFSLPSSEIIQACDKNLPKSDSCKNDPIETIFVLNLVDIGLSYEPYLGVMSSTGRIPDLSSSTEGKKDGEKHVACLVAASSLSLSNATRTGSICCDYTVVAKDLGLLLSSLQNPENMVDSYSVENLYKIGYVNVAREAFVEATFRTNCKNGCSWELECSESHSHIFFDTCHDTAAGLIRLVDQLQDLFAPDMEESIVHLQARWDSVKQVRERIDPNNNDISIESVSSASDPYTSSIDKESKPSIFRLMDEICEDAFQLDEKHFDSDPCRSKIHHLVDGSALVESCDVITTTPEIFTKPDQTSLLEKGCIPEIIESYYRAESLQPSGVSVIRKPLNEISECKSSKLGKDGSGRKNNGWYGDTTLKIVENHILEVSEKNEQGQYIEGKRTGDFQRAKGRILLKNIDVRWRLFAGSDWPDFKNEQSTSVHGRDKRVCLELALSGINLQYNIFPEGQICISKFNLEVQDFHLYDKSENAPWKLVLGYYDSKEHPRESSSKAFKLELEVVRPDPLISLDEYRLNINFLPMQLHLHQDQFDFVINFFVVKTTPDEQSCSLPEDYGGPKLSPSKCNTFQNLISEEALLPYFQKFDIWPVVIRVDYTPSHVDLAALKGGKYAELINLVPWKGIELQLKQVHAVGVYGWSTVLETIMGEWVEDIFQNQIYKLLQGFPTIRSLVAVGSGAAKLVSFPVKSYKKDHRLLKGMQRGTLAFLKSISLEAVGLGLHLAAGTRDIFLQAEYILTTVPPSVHHLPLATRATANMMSCNQPKDAQQGIQQACESLKDGLGRSVSAFVQAPLKSYQRGSGAGSAFANAVRAVPAAAIAPASAAAGALHFALLGVRNSLDPEHKRESMKKYSGSSQFHEPS